MITDPFVISDTHFGHANIIKYCARPFADVYEMNDYMIDKWNSVVGKNDTVIHVGDFTLGPVENIKNYRRRLNGFITLVKGNHDRANRTLFIAAGFVDFFQTDLIVRSPINESHSILFQHRPRLTPPDDDTLIVHGHIHNQSLFPLFCSWNINASAEVIDYTPRRLSYLIAKHMEYLNNDTNTNRTSC